VKYFKGWLTSLACRFEGFYYNSKLARLCIKFASVAPAWYACIPLAAVLVWLYKYKKIAKYVQKYYLQ